VHILRLLTYTVLRIFITVSYSNWIAVSPQNMIMVEGVAYGCCSFHEEGSLFTYVIGRFLVLNITKFQTSKVHGLGVLFACAMRISCNLLRWCWSSNTMGCNDLLITTPCRLSISSCCCWPTTECNGIHCAYSRSNCTKLESVDECVDVLYASSASGSIVSH